MTNGVPLRSSLLAYWTGKDLLPANEPVTPRSREGHVGRLRDILTSGFWMTTPTEKLVGGATSGGVFSFEYQTPMTCFTEVRLTQSRVHSERYGRLAIVVDRQFVLERWGGPVHYVRNNADEFVVSNFRLLRNWISRLLDDPKLRNIVPLLPENRSSLDLLFSMLKGMSDAGSDNHKYLDEHEWRIPFSQGQLQFGRLFATGQDRPKFKVSLFPKDVRMIVFPDAETRVLAMKDKVIDRWMSGIAEAPPLLTIAECGEM